MMIFSIILMAAWIPFIYFIVDKRLSAFFTKKFKVKKTYDENKPYEVKFGPFGSFSPAVVMIYAMIVVPVIFIGKFGGTFNSGYIIGFIVVTFISILIGTLERMYYR
jgi:amino acid permease